jgi:secernin
MDPSMTGMSSRQTMVRIGCDSLVALPPVTADGAVLFAKNSDRPADECQPLLGVPRQRHAKGARLRCTYIDIPQAAETAAVLGARPHWCWGFEHGLNEHGVAIGNHTVFTRDDVSGTGLIGMDLVRLGLERGRTAEEATNLIASFVEYYGQGGSGYADKDWPYHNSFLLADRHAAFVLETSDRRWAARRVEAVAALSNHLSIGTDWTALADGTIEHAIAAGWWPEGCDERFDFAAAYRDTSMAPGVISSGRHRRTCDWLAQHRGSLEARDLQRALRDHYGEPAPLLQLGPGDERYFSVCMHADPVGTTTASLVAHIPADEQPPLYWASLGSPCVGAFIPLFLDVPLPGALTLGGAEASNDSAWWACKRLLTCVEADWAGRAPAVRDTFDRFEADLVQRMARRGIVQRPADERAVFVQDTVRALLEEVRRLCARFA